jgi:hypothetical protein
MSEPVQSKRPEQSKRPDDPDEPTAPAKRRLFDVMDKMMVVALMGAPYKERLGKTTLDIADMLDRTEYSAAEVMQLDEYEGFLDGVIAADTVAAGKIVREAIDKSERMRAMTFDAQKFNHNGYLHVKRSLDLDDIDSLDKALAAIPQVPGPDMFEESGSGLIKQIQRLDSRGEVFADLIAMFGPIAAKLLGKKAKFMHMQMVAKLPHISKMTRPHQDNAYFKEGPHNDVRALSFWIPLDDIDEENGALYYDTGRSHLGFTQEHERFSELTTFRVRCGVPGQSLCLKHHIEMYDKPMLVKRGDVCVHHSNLIHRAGRNTSDRARRAIVIVFSASSEVRDERLWAMHAARLGVDEANFKIRDPKGYWEYMEASKCQNAAAPARNTVESAEKESESDDDMPELVECEPVGKDGIIICDEGFELSGEDMAALAAAAAANVE